MTTHDPFDELATPAERQDPRPSFTRALRARIVAELGTDPEEPPTVPLPERKPTMSTTAPASTVATTVTPYLAATDAAAALDWYRDAFGAVEQFRVVGDDGRLGHAEFTIGTARFMLSDAYPEIGVHSPQSLGGTSTTLHLQVENVDDIYARATRAGATGQTEPADQPHGARHGTLIDPYGHRWMLSQQIETPTLDEYAERSAGTGYTVVEAEADAAAADVVGTAEGETIAAADRPGTGGGIWAAVFYRDALAGIRFLVETFGFTEQLVVVGDDGETVVHSQLRWPEGGIVQAGTYNPNQPRRAEYPDIEEDPFLHVPGDQSLYVVTADPHAVWARCASAGVEVIRAPEEPDYAPGTMMFTVRDPEGNVWSFGSYGLGADA